MDAKLKITGIAVFAAVLGLGASGLSAQSTDKVDVNSANTPGWKMFSAPASGSDAPQAASIGSNDSSSLSAIASDSLTSRNAYAWSALQTTDAPATTAGTPLPEKTIAVSGQSSNQANVSLPTSAQDLSMDINPQSDSTRHSDQSTPGMGTVSVPFPTAAWTGLTGLLGLGFVAYRKKIARLFV